MAEIFPEICFGLDNFQQPKTLTLKETFAQMILNLFMMRPGNYPSMPHIGIDIEQYLYRLEDDFDPEEIREKLYTQCADLFSYISLGDVKVFVTPYKGYDVLIVTVPLNGLSEDGDTLLFGFSKNSKNEMSFTFQYQDNVSKI